MSTDLQHADRLGDVVERCRDDAVSIGGCERLSRGAEIWRRARSLTGFLAIRRAFVPESLHELERLSLLRWRQFVESA